MSKIEWCDITLNPIVGCSKCSPGCENCYAEKFAARLAKNPATAKKYVGVVDEKGWTGQFSQPSLADFRKLPKSPRRVFIGSMTDIFHDEIVKGGEYHKTWLPMLFDAMLNYPQHTFLLLTKRPENMKRWIDFTLEACVDMPLPNVWLGVTVCDQQEVDKKVPVLLETPAEKRFISVEPMLGPVNLWRFFPAGSRPEPLQITLGLEKACLNHDYENGIHWVICGAETGRNARPLHPEWIRNLKGQCISARVPFFFKSWGEWLPCTQCPDDMDVEKYAIGEISNDGFFNPPPCHESPFRNGTCTEDVLKVGKKRSDHLIDGVEYRQFPKVKNA